MQITDLLLAFIGAWLFAIIFRGRDLAILAKRNEQRTADEKRKAKGGLMRVLIIEFLILVPTSTTLILLIVPALLSITKMGIGPAIQRSSDIRRAFYVSLGVISYNFPFIAVKELATRIALNTIREFYLHHGQRDSVSKERDRSERSEGEEKVN